MWTQEKISYVSVFFFLFHWLFIVNEKKNNHPTHDGDTRQQFLDFI